MSATNPQPIQQKPTVVPKNLKKITASTLGNSSAENLNLKTGMMVNHERFGNGIINELENGKATINFQDGNTKQLLLKFAKLTIVN